MTEQTPDHPQGSKHVEPPNDPRVPTLDDESPEESRETGGAAPAVGPGD